MTPEDILRIGEEADALADKEIATPGGATRTGTTCATGISPHWWPLPSARLAPRCVNTEQWRWTTTAISMCAITLRLTVPAPSEQGGRHE